jgi:hypothetical protein
VTHLEWSVREGNALCEDDRNVNRESVQTMSDESRTELAGMIGRISIPVPVDGPGEIILSVRGGSEAFTAYTLTGETLSKNARAVVMEQTGSRTVLVTAC